MGGGWRETIDGRWIWVDTLSSTELDWIRTESRGGKGMEFYIFLQSLASFNGNGGAAIIYVQ